MTLQKSFAILLASFFLVFTMLNPVLAADRRVKIVNNTGYTIVEFYGSNVRSDNWEKDMLGYDVIPVGQVMMLNFDDNSGYCMFDFKAVFDDGVVLTKKHINVCKIGTYTYH